MVVRVTVTLPEELLLELDSIAAEESLTRSDVVREAAGSYVARRTHSAQAAARRDAVAEGLAWLDSIARAPRAGQPSSLDLLRELRGDEAEVVAPIEPED